jgi:hypothetical protein
MNNANEISHHTKLYGFIGEESGKSSFSATMNRLFKANNKDAMMIPMNIREDDFYYTLANMRKSHVNGAVISNEFTGSVVEHLQESTKVVLKSGMCDILVRDGEKFVGDIFSINVLIDFLKSKEAKKIALIGINPHAKAFTYLASFEEFDVSYFNDDVDDLMNFTVEMKVGNADINRISSGMSIDLSGYDAVLEFSHFTNLDMIEKLSDLNIDMKNKTEFSALKSRAKELQKEYIGYDNLLEELSKNAYGFFEKHGHLEYDKSQMRF